jgi:23S rRNA (uracil1939-C5)-methyltransferase
LECAGVASGKCYPYEKQLEYKQQQVTDNLKRIGKVPLPPIQPILGANETTQYRNKMEYTFSTKRFLLQEELSNPNISSEENVVGFHARGLFDKVVPIITCHLQAEPTNRLRLAIRDYAAKNNLSHYDIREHHGFLRNLQVRLATTGELMVNIIFGHEDTKKRTALLDYVLSAFPK